MTMKWTDDRKKESCCKDMMVEFKADVRLGQRRFLLWIPSIYFDRCCFLCTVLVKNLRFGEILNDSDRFSV